MRRETTSFFLRELLKWYRKNGRFLPWRKKGIGPYEVWVSEIMLQQTQVSRVIPFYEKFLKRFPTIQKLSKTQWQNFFPYYRGLGYYQRGKNMLETARRVVQEYDGKFPEEKSELEKLPGIGEYTARAILSFAYKKPYLSKDTNHKRVLGRFFLGKKDAIVSSSEIESHFQGPFWKLNAALMDFASIVCGRSPKCEECPLKKKCQYFNTRGILESHRPDHIGTGQVPIQFLSRDAQVFLWLHNGHKEYYSSNTDQFEVFQLTKEYNTRSKIKEYFKKKYDLELAVRPPHKKVFVENIPTLFVNAQILLGKHEFGVFSKEEVRKVYSF